MLEVHFGLSRTQTVFIHNSPLCWFAGFSYFGFSQAQGERVHAYLESDAEGGGGVGDVFMYLFWKAVGVNILLRTVY